MRRAGLLVEMMVAIALFVGAGLIVLGALRDGVRSTIRAIERDRAVDVAASAFAQVDAGILTVSAVDGPVEAWRDPEDTSNFEDLEPPPSDWIIEAQSDASPFGELTYLSITAVRSRPDGRPDEEGERVTIEGLVFAARETEGAAPPEDAINRELDRLESRR